MEVPETTPGRAGSRVWPAVALGLVAAAWAAFVLTLRYVGRLEGAWGPAPDVVDSLGRAAYISRRTLGYYTLVLALDAAAAAALVHRSRPGWPRVAKWAAASVLLPSAGLHGLAWLINWFFA